MGYRYYEMVGVKPLFSFGYGLSYTSFHLSNLAVFQDSKDSKKITDEMLDISVVVENVGSRGGAETAQVYISPPPTASVARPVRELKGFKKVRLNPGERQEIKISIPSSLATSFWDESRSAWLSEAGEYTITVVGTGKDNSISQTFTMGRSRWWNGLFGSVVNDVSSLHVNGIGGHP